MRHNTQPITIPVQDHHSLCVDFPIRTGFLAQLIIPRDMTKREAERLCAFVQALAFPETVSENPP